MKHFAGLLGIFLIKLHVTIDKNCMWTLLGCRAQWHGRMHAEFAGLIRRSRHHAALVPLAANDYGLAFQRRIEQLFHRDKKCVHIHMKDDSPGR